MLIAGLRIAYSWRSFAQAHWYWLPRVETVPMARALDVRWLCLQWIVTGWPIIGALLLSGCLHAPTLTTADAQAIQAVRGAWRAAGLPAADCPVEVRRWSSENPPESSAHGEMARGNVLYLSSARRDTNNGTPALASQCG